VLAESIHTIPAQLHRDTHAHKHKHSHILEHTQYTLHLFQVLDAFAEGVRAARASQGQAAQLVEPPAPPHVPFPPAPAPPPDLRSMPSKEGESPAQQAAWTVSRAWRISCSLSSLSLA